MTKLQKTDWHFRHLFRERYATKYTNSFTDRTRQTRARTRD